MSKGKSLLEYTNLFSPNGYKKNDKIILKIFQQNLNKLKCVVIIVSHEYEYEKMFKKEESIEILKVLGLIDNIEEYPKIYNHA